MANERYVTWLEKSRIWPWNRAKYLRHLPVRAREDLWNYCGTKSGDGLCGCLTLFFVIPICLVLSEVVYHFANNVYSLGPWISQPSYLSIMLGPPILLMCFFDKWRSKWVKRHLFEDFRSGKPRPICLNCGYNLKGLPTSTTQCPECGFNFQDNPFKYLIAYATWRHQHLVV